MVSAYTTDSHRGTVSLLYSVHCAVVHVGFHGKGVAILKLGEPTYYFYQFFPEKLHENEKKWTAESGGGTSVVPLGSANAVFKN